MICEVTDSGRTYDSHLTVPHAVFLLALSSGLALLSLLQMKTVPGLNSGLELISRKIEPFLRIKCAWTPVYLATGAPMAPGSITSSFILFLNRENRLLEKILIPSGSEILAFDNARLLSSLCHQNTGGHEHLGQIHAATQCGKTGFVRLGTNYL